MMHEVEIIKANRKISERTAGKIADVLRVAPYARVSTDSECYSQLKQAVKCLDCLTESCLV